MICNLLFRVELLLAFCLIFAIFKIKVKLNFIIFLQSGKFENLRFCLNGNCVIGTVTFAFCRKLKNSIVDFDLKIFFWIASLNLNVKSVLLARLTNFIDNIKFQSIFACFQNRLRFPLISAQNSQRKNLCVYRDKIFPGQNGCPCFAANEKFDVEGWCWVRTFEAQKTTTTSVKRP